MDLKDLRAVVAFLVSDTGKAELKNIGGLSTVTAGVILRALTAFEQQGAGGFFAEPEFDTSELLRTGAGSCPYWSWPPCRTSRSCSRRF